MESTLSIFFLISSASGILQMKKKWHNNAYCMFPVVSEGDDLNIFREILPGLNDPHWFQSMLKIFSFVSILIPP